MPVTHHVSSFTAGRLNKAELKSTIQSIEKTHTLISSHKGSSDLIAEVEMLFSCIKWVKSLLFCDSVKRKFIEWAGYPKDLISLIHSLDIYGAVFLIQEIWLRINVVDCEWYLVAHKGLTAN